MSGPPCLSSFRDASIKEQWITLLLYSSTAIAYAKSTSLAIHVRKLKTFGRQCKCHSRSSQLCACQLWAYTGQFFPIHSWVDLRHVCDTSTWMPFHFRDYRNCFFCPPLTSFTFGLQNIPHSGYISPEAMATCLSMLTSSSNHFRLEFESPHSCPDQESRRPPPPTRFILPALRTFLFKGVNEYLEEFMARIDAPHAKCKIGKF